MDHNNIIESGLLELYALGLLKGAEFDYVNEAWSRDPELAQELGHIEEAMLVVAQLGAVSPNPTIKPLLMAKFDYAERLRKGEVPAHVPVLNTFEECRISTMAAARGYAISDRF